MLVIFSVAVIAVRVTVVVRVAVVIVRVAVIVGVTVVVRMAVRAIRTSLYRGSQYPHAI